MWSMADKAGSQIIQLDISLVACSPKGRPNFTVD